MCILAPRYSCSLLNTTPLKAGGLASLSAGTSQSGTYSDLMYPPTQRKKERKKHDAIYRNNWSISIVPKQEPPQLSVRHQL